MAEFLDVSYWYWVWGWIIAIVILLMIIVLIRGGDYSTPKDFERKDDPHDHTGA